MPRLRASIGRSSRCDSRWDRVSTSRFRVGDGAFHGGLRRRCAAVCGLAGVEDRSGPRWYGKVRSSAIALDDAELLSRVVEEFGTEAFLNNSRLAIPMARFPEAERRRLHKMICMQCYARNAMRATRCRKCGSRELRPKAKEARKE